MYMAVIQGGVRAHTVVGFFIILILNEYASWILKLNVYSSNSFPPRVCSKPSAGHCEVQPMCIREISFKDAIGSL